MAGESPLPRSHPDADVIFDIDANGILNVHVVQQSIGKENKSTITNDKGRLNSVEIQRMVQQAARGGQERYS
jgi:heat shock 70kDa protein 1/2/6/8